MSKSIIPLGQRRDILKATYDKIMKSKKKTITGATLDGCDVWSIDGASGDVCVGGGDCDDVGVGKYAIFFDLDCSDIMLRYECL